MLNTIVGQITGVLRREFLFAALVPTLLFVFAVGATLAWVVGVEAVVRTAEAMPATRAAFWSGAAMLSLVLAAYVLAALQPVLVRLWSGESLGLLLFGLHRIGTSLHRRHYDVLHRRSEMASPWKEVLDHFREGVRDRQARARQDARFYHRWWLGFQVRALSASQGAERVCEDLDGPLAAFERFRLNSLEPVFEAVNRRLTWWHQVATARHQAAAEQLDRRFARRVAVRPTRLGNTIAAYQEYSFSRYEMEAEVFWPRLRYVIPKEHFELVENQRVLLDFCLGVATLAAVYALLALVAGPWLYDRASVWIVLSLAGVVVSSIFYRVAVVAAERLGDLVRSCFDLFRLSLLDALGRKRPKNLEQERTLWKELSQLVVYGEPQCAKTEYASAQ